MAINAYGNTAVDIQTGINGGGSGAGVILLNRQGGSVAIGKATANGALDVNGNVIISGSLNVSGSQTLTGSLIVSAGITGSISGAVFGYVANTQTGSFILSSQTGSMSVATASFALTASYALNASAGGISQGKVVAIVTGISNLF
jgi:hypothetical protein